MATILLNGVVTDASSISGSDLADKLTVSGGVDGLSVDLADGDDAVEIYADSEDVSDAEIRVSAGNDVIVVVANDGSQNNADDAAQFAGESVSIGDSLLGGPGADVIRLEDGLVQLSGAVKGNEDNDTIHVANINGGTVNGNSGNDTLTIGTFAIEEAGSRAANAVSSGSVMGGKGNDTITVDAVVTGSGVRGNEGDDTITLTGSTFSGANTVNGNAGDDTIDASGAAGSITVIGGRSDDTLVVGNGQTVRGGMGADLFSVEASGGVTIEDYDELGKEACFCDDEIQIDGNKVELATYNYDVNRVDNTSASSWVGNLKVKAVIDADNCPTTAKVTYTATKTETLNATAVAFLKVTQTKDTNTYTDALALNPDPGYPAKGFTQNGATFVNGLAGYEYGDARGGIGQGFASGTGFWLTDGNGLPAGNVTASSVKLPYASTSAKFAKGDFSFLQLTKTAKAGCTTTQKLVYDDVTRGTVTNHHVSYIKEKNTSNNELYSLSFGTNNFATAYTGKGFMIVTDGLEDKAYKTTTLEAVTVGATAKVTLTLNNFFSAWLPNNAGTGTTAAGDWDAIATAGVLGAPAGLDNPATGRYETAGGGIAFNLASGVTAKGAETFTAADAVTSKQAFWSTLQNRGLLTLAVKAVAPQNQIPATALTALAGPVTGSATASYTANITEVDRDIFATNIGKHVVKIRVSDSDTAKASQALATIVERTTFTNTVLPVTTCPSFPATPFGNGKFASATNRTGKHGDLVTADGGTAFGAHLLWQNSGLRMSSSFNIGALAASNDSVGVTGEAAVAILDGRVYAAMTANGAPTSATTTTVTTTLTNTFGTTGSSSTTSTIANSVTNVIAVAGRKEVTNQGFFSGSDWKVSILAAAGMGNNVTTTGAADNVDGAPFRVLFFDNEGTDNGLYVYSGTANYLGGDVTAINTNPTGSSAMGGKHTIVKVTAGKGHEIALSDINFV